MFLLIDDDFGVFFEVDIVFGFVVKSSGGCFCSVDVGVAVIQIILKFYLVAVGTCSVILAIAVAKGILWVHTVGDDHDFGSSSQGAVLTNTAE